METIQHSKRTEYLYKAIPSMAEVHPTMMLAEHGFLCMAAHQSGERDAYARYVRSVRIGDIVHYYFSSPGKRPRSFGRYMIIEADEHPERAAFGNRIQGTALHALTDERFLTRYGSAHRYERDPKLGLFTGWLLRKLGPALPVPMQFARGRATLVPLRADQLVAA